MPNPHVLVVDDSDVSRKVVAAKLAQLQARVTEAGNGAEALALLLAGGFDLAIVDLEMPGVNGLDLLGCIRSHASLRHMPVIILTGREDRQALEAALSYGATSFLVKPLNWLAFGEHIRHLLYLSRCARMVAQGGIMSIEMLDATATA